MARWTCPACGRTFARRGQGHLCVPVNQLGDYLAALPDGHRAVAEAIISLFAGLDDVDIEAADVGLFFKRSRKFAQLRPRRKWLVLILLLRRKLDDPRVRSTMRATNSAIAHNVRLETPEDIDDDVRGWLIEAYQSF